MSKISYDYVWNYPWYCIIDLNCFQGFCSICRYAKANDEAHKEANHKTNALNGQKSNDETSNWLKEGLNFWSVCLFNIYLQLNTMSGLGGQYKVCSFCSSIGKFKTSLITYAHVHAHKWCSHRPVMHAFDRDNQVCVAHWQRCSPQSFLEKLIKDLSLLVSDNSELKEK